MKFCGYDIHPAALIPGNLDPDTYKRLRESILKVGQLVPVLVWKDQIVDGVHRAKICHEEGIGLKTVELPDDDSPTEAAMAMFNRRDSTPSQRAAWAAEAEPMLAAEAKERERLRKSKTTLEKIPESETPAEEISRLYNENKTRGNARDKAAKLLKVNPRYVQDAKKIKEESPETFEKLKTGATTLQEAKRTLHLTASVTKPADKAPEDDDSDCLFHLKRYWNAATKKDRAKFDKWRAENK